VRAQFFTTKPQRRISRIALMGRFAVAEQIRMAVDHLLQQAAFLMVAIPAKDAGHISGRIAGLGGRVCQGYDRRIITRIAGCMRNVGCPSVRGGGGFGPAHQAHRLGRRVVWQLADQG
jgi:hypothetical protein